MFPIEFSPVSTVATHSYWSSGAAAAGGVVGPVLYVCPGLKRLEN